ncbi:M28 family peptidase [Pseudogemmobacter sonorensis]|uniref:M28 family peptidase n=1 Tax=Pseudogemmobacter sonorensis TaxID=2989681 RepID=UPI003695B549
MSLATLMHEIDRARMMRDLETFAKRVKLSGTPEELESFRYLQSQLDAAGFHTRLILHDAYISLPGAASLETEDGSESFECITHSFGQNSPPGGLAGSMVDVGAPDQANFDRHDLRGKIAIIDGLCAPLSAKRARDVGAIGQIHVMPYEHRHEMCISNVWGSPEPEELDLLPQTVAVTVNAEAGARLRALIAAGDARVRMTAKVSTGWCKTPILEADLPAPGTDAEAPFILFSGHHDTWFEGVMDNGGANATMLEVARIIAGHRDQIRRGLRLCFWSGHSHGRYSGSQWYADNHWGELSRRCAVHVNIDSTGAKGNVILENMAVSDELKALASEAVTAISDQVLQGERLSRAGDQSFWGIGIPSMFISVGEQDIALGLPNLVSFMGGQGKRRGAGYGWWWHTADDTLDKMDPEILERDTGLYLHTIWRLLTDLVPPVDHAAWCKGFGETLLPMLDLAAEAGFDSTECRQSFERFSALAAQFNACREANPTAALQVLMAVSRALVPIDYTSGDRFRPDPALPLAAVPVLDPLRALLEAARQGQEKRHHAVAARRALNRIVMALAEATTALDSYIVERGR